jgi:hypothetical protein
MSYNNNIIKTIGVDNESTYGKLSITVAVDTLGMCTISFGTSSSIRIPEDDVDSFRDVLSQASKQLMVQRNEAEQFEFVNREVEEEMAQEAKDYSPEEEVFNVELFEGTMAELNKLVDVIK